ncbi:MAG: hypothetical protein U0R68_15065 [Candidatus Nanopelagicales bacterium]
MGDTTDDLDLTCRESRWLVLGNLVGAPFFVLACLGAGATVDSGTLPGPVFWVGAVGLLAVGGALEPLRIRIRSRSGLRTWIPRQRDDLRMLRAAARSCGWPERAVLAALVVAFLVCAAAAAVLVLRVLQGL